MEGRKGGSNNSSKAIWRDDVVQRHNPAARTLGPEDDGSVGTLWGVVHRDIATNWDRVLVN